jgi:hypothetical protein
MKRPARVTSDLPESLHQRLNTYVLAASAASIGILGLPQSAETKIIYTKIHHVIGDPSRYALALDNKKAYFLFSATRCPYHGTGCTDNYFAGLFVQPVSRGNAVLDVNGSNNWAAALRSGARISNTRNWASFGAMVTECEGLCTSGTQGYWVNVTDRYLGLKFRINGKFHYGWARLNVTAPKGKFRITATLTGYAFETIPGKPIIAGKTHGKDEATLGHLATGASAIPAWRMKPTAATTH